MSRATLDVTRLEPGARVLRKPCGCPVSWLTPAEYAEAYWAAYLDRKRAQGFTVPRADEDARGFCPAHDPYLGVA